MHSIERLAERVGQMIQLDRVGALTACRVTATIADHGNIEACFARYLALVADWFSAPPLAIRCWGAVREGHFAAILTLARGQSALVSVALAGASRPVEDVVLVGSHGVAHWECDEDSPNDTVAAAPTQEAQRLLQAALQSATARQVIRFDGRQPHVPYQSATTNARPTIPSIYVRAAPLVPPFGVLLVAGSHTHQENYAASFAGDARCRIIGVCDAIDIDDRRRKLNERLARELSVPWLPDLDAALARDDVHIVSICAEPERRAPIIVRAAAAGKHLYLDKPLAASVGEADAIVAAATRAGVLTQMFSQVRTSVGDRLQRAIDAGEVGEPLALHLDLFFAKGHGGTAALGRPRVEDAAPTAFERIVAKREMYNIGVYPLTLAVHLLRRPVESVLATTANCFFREHQEQDFEDFGQLAAVLEGGVVCTICVGRTGWTSHPASGIHRATLVGSRGVIRADLFRPRLEVWSNPAIWSPPRPHPDDPMAFWSSTQEEMGALPKVAWIPAQDARDDIHHFIDCVQRGEASDVDCGVAAHVLEVLLAAYRSAAEGGEVRLPLERQA